MKTTHLVIAFWTFFSLGIMAQTTTIPVFEEVLFYDGYAELVEDPNVTFPENIIRHRNDLYAIKLTDAQLASFGDQTTMTVIIKPSCDNYDRIGGVNLALLPKGQETYKPEEVERIELGRFITPFMDKNKQPDEVAYDFDLDYIKQILKEKSLQEKYDFWVELEVFGVPYAAQKQIEGCDGRSDVFFGSLYFHTSAPQAKVENNNVLIPLYAKHHLNNYREGATEELGKTVLVNKFNLDSDLKDVKLILITSNHGANRGGEEYARRNHYVYLDGKEILSYKPGRVSCEPFRERNSQGNGIYGREVKTDAQWQSFSNWCPGDVIDTRIMEFDKLNQGSHTFQISVPDARFVDKEGYIPVSLFLLGKIGK